MKRKTFFASLLIFAFTLSTLFPPALPIFAEPMESVTGSAIASSADEGLEDTGISESANVESSAIGTSALNDSAPDVDDNDPTESYAGDKSTVESESTGESSNVAVPPTSASLGETESSDTNSETGESDSSSEPATTLYDRLMAATNFAEAEELLRAASQQEIDSLSSEQLAALEQHLGTIDSAGRNVVPSTVSMTQAAPFKSPVQVTSSALRRMAMANSRKLPGEDDNGLVTDKNAVSNGDGTYTITMETYTTGTVTTVEQSVPVDVVLVLDQSGSMTDSFPGAANRQAAMKTSVNNFISSVADEFNAQTADHRISIVTFAGSSSIRNGWTYLNPAGTTALQNSVNTLPNPSGATNASAGMANAETLMGAQYNYTGANTTRNKVVIVFTDGVPTAGNRFDATVATNAIQSAKNLKDSGVTVYSIGIFGGANPNQLYGESGFYENSNGTVGSHWAERTFLSIGDVTNVDIPAGNRFLNYLSSNFMDAVQIGLTEYSAWVLVFLYKGWEITKIEDRTDTGYYLSAANAGELDNIFESIAQNIETPKISLGSNTVVRDTVSPYFTLPANVSQIDVYKAAATATTLTDDSWGARTPLALTPTITGNTVSVTGFDYDANFVTDTPKEDGSYGSKLIIEFVVTPKDGFLGGNGVTTNEGLTDGVYDPDGILVESFDPPTVDVPLESITINISDADFGSYYGQPIDQDDLKLTAEVKIGGIELDFNEPNFGLEPWQNEYVDIQVTPSTNATGGFDQVTTDFTYMLEVTVTPKKTGTISSEGETGTGSGMIKVFKPKLTFKDSDVWYGDTATYGDTVNLVNQTWVHGDLDHSATDLTMLNNEPMLSLDYIPDSTKLSAGTVNTKQDIPVKVDVSIPFGVAQTPQNINEHTIFVHQDCAPPCAWVTPVTPGDPAFLLHVKTASLTITKTGGESDEPYVFTIKKDGAPYTKATVVGNGSVTITELPIGTYTIEEDLDWSWRYSASVGSGVELTKTSPEGVIACANSKIKQYWLNKYSSVWTNQLSDSD